MAIDYSALAFPKTRPKALDKADKDKALAAKDKAENAKAKKRAKGQCEVYVIAKEWSAAGMPCSLAWRCYRKDTQTHHLLGGIGRRNRGKSVLAQFKLRVCADCHAAITSNVLKPTTATHDARSVRFWRAR